MASMNVSVPDPMRDWVQSRIDGGQYASVSDYVRDLIRRDQQATVERERMLSALDKSVLQGVAEAKAGLGRDLDEVCDELEARYTHMANARGAV